MFRSAATAMAIALICLPATACSSGERTPTGPRQQASAVVDTGPYAAENAALDRAVEMTGLPREASIWVKRTADSRVVCGALARPEGKPVLYLAGPEAGTGYVGAPLARVSPELGERLLDQANEAVMINCADHGLIPPERVRALLE